MTFSIVARTGDAYGVAVASKFIAAGSVVPAARLGVCHCHAGHGQGVVRIGRSCVAGPLAQAPRTRLPGSPGWTRGARTVSSAWSVPADQCTFTGAGLHGLGRGCHRVGDADSGHAIQGNFLVGERVVLDMDKAWLEHPELALAPRLMEALVAGDHAAGDKRGRQSAALYAVAPGAGYDHCGVLDDLRVDECRSANIRTCRVVGDFRKVGSLLN